MKKISRVLIFGNGRLDISYLKRIKAYDYIVGVDAAALWLIRHQVIPHVAIGDFDSVTKPELDFINEKIKNTKAYPANKDKTDMHLAVNHALSLKPKEILMFGALGSRLDHSLVNINLLSLCCQKKVAVRIIDQNNEIWLIDKSCLIPKIKKYSYFSVLSYTKESVVTITGSKYDIKEKLIQQNQTIGVSNEVVGKQCRIDAIKGTILLVRSRD